MSGWSESPPRHWLWSNGGASVEGTEIYGFVGGAWHGLPPLWCHVTALLRQRRVIPLDWAPWMNAVLSGPGRSACLGRLPIVSCFPRLPALARAVWRSFLCACPFPLCPALTWQSTWGDYQGYLSGGNSGALRIGGVLNAARAEIDLAFFRVLI